MKHLPIFIITAIVALASCKNETKTTDTVVSVDKLSVAGVYSFDSVVAYLRQVKATQEDAKQYLNIVKCFGKDNEAVVV